MSNVVEVLKKDALETYLCSSKLVTALESLLKQAGDLKENSKSILDQINLDRIEESDCYKQESLIINSLNELNKNYNYYNSIVNNSISNSLRDKILLLNNKGKK